MVGSAVLLCLEELPVALINGVLPGALAGNTVKVEELPLLARPAELERVRLVRDELGLGDPEEVLGLIGIDAQAHGVVHEVLVRKVMVPVGDILEDHDNTLGKRMAKKGPHLQGVFAHPPLASDDFQNRNAWLLEM